RGGLDGHALGPERPQGVLDGRVGGRPPARDAARRRSEGSEGPSGARDRREGNDPGGVGRPPLGRTADLRDLLRKGREKRRAQSGRNEGFLPERGVRQGRRRRVRDGRERRLQGDAEVKRVGAVFTHAATKSPSKTTSAPPRMSRC